MGDAAMRTLTPIFIMVAAFVAAYAEAAFTPFRFITGAQIDILPALVVYTALTHGVSLVAVLSVCGGLWFDSLSSNPLGVSIIPLFFVGIVIYRYRTLLLRDHPYAQFVMGAIASAVVPIVTLLFLFTLDRDPLFGWGSIWQLFVMSLCGGLMAPLLFRFFDWLTSVLAYQQVKESSFRQDRIITRGRK